MNMSETAADGCLATNPALNYQEHADKARLAAVTELFAWQQHCKKNPPHSELINWRDTPFHTLPFLFLFCDN